MGAAVFDLFTVFYSHNSKRIGFFLLIMLILKMSHDMTKPTKCAQWVAKDPSFLHADSEDSDQTGHPGRMPRLI